MRQNLAVCKWQDFSTDGRQHGKVVHYDYRRSFRENLKRLMDYYKASKKAFKPAYRDGTKKGKRVSPRSLRYYANDPNASAPSLDMLDAIAAAAEMEVWQLLVPNMRAEPEYRPVTIESMEERALLQGYRARHKPPERAAAEYAGPERRRGAAGVPADVGTHQAPAAKGTKRRPAPNGKPRAKA